MYIFNLNNIHKYFNIIIFKFNKILAFFLLVFFVSACGISKGNFKAFDKDVADVSNHEGFFDDGSSLSGIYNKDYNLFLTYLDKSESVNKKSTYQFVTCSSEVLKEQIEYCTLDDGQNAYNDNSLNRCPEQNVLAKHCVRAFQGLLITDRCQGYENIKDTCSQVSKFWPKLEQDCIKVLADPEADSNQKKSCYYSMDFHRQCQKKLPIAAATCEAALQYQQLNCSDEAMADEKCQELDFDPESRIMSEIVDPEVNSITRVSSDFHAQYEKFNSRKQNEAALFLNGLSYGSLLPIFLSKNGRIASNQFGQTALNKITKEPKWWLSGTFNFLKTSAIVMPSFVYDPLIVEDHQKYTLTGACFQTLLGTNVHPYVYPPLEDISDNAMILKKQVLPASIGFASNWAIIRATSNYSPPVRFGSMVTLPFVATIMSFLNTDHSTGDVSNNLDSIFEHHESLPASNELELTKLRVDMHKLLPMLGRSLTYLQKTYYMTMQRYCLPKLQDGEYVSECFPIYDGDEGFMYKLGTGAVKAAMDKGLPTAAEQCMEIKDYIFNNNSQS